MPPGLSPLHLLVVVVVALIVVGPEKGLEAIGNGARLLGEARQWIARTSEELQSVVSSPSEEPSVLTAHAPTAPGAVAGDAEPASQPPAGGTAPPGVQPVFDAAAVSDAVPTSSPRRPAEAGHRPAHQEEPHL